MREPFQSDVPSSGDELKRRPFAERIARTLASSDVKGSLVLGLHAPVGDGKTTVLRFIQESLGNEPAAACVEFNPWQIGSAVDLAPALLATLADALEARPATQGAGAPSALRNYAKFFGPPGQQAGISDHKIDQQSAVRLASAKAEADRALAESGTRVVVLMDDVDRLDAARLEALFKAMKMTADFANVVYVMAGDDAVIAGTLSVALSRVDAGRELLEKVIQVPLSIPKADSDLLRDFFLRRLKATLDPSAISVRPDAEARFSEMFLQGLQPRLKTPRTAKRLINALGFALELLKSRVNTVDLIVIEGIRLLYPNLHRSIRENRDDFLWYRISRDGPDADNRASELLHQSSAGLKLVEQEAVQFLVRSLFPAFDRSRYPSRGDIERWSDDKRICSPEHFDRFFDYRNA